LDAPWIGKAVGIAILVAIPGFLWLSCKLQNEGVFKNYSRGLGRGLFEVETMLRPSKQHVREAKELKKRTDDDERSSDPDPD
jgi:hypothetical protein